MERDNIEKNMVCGIIDTLITERVEEEIKEDSTYMFLSEEQKKVERQYQRLELLSEQNKFMQQYFAAMENSCIAFSHCAYKTGFLDCLAILNDLNIIGEGEQKDREKIVLFDI